MKAQHATVELEQSERGFRWKLLVERGSWGTTCFSAWKETPDHAWEDLLSRLKSA